jgi:hypothetical protein
MGLRSGTTSSSGTATPAAPPPERILADLEHFDGLDAA